jgi:hypothetical protein
MPEAVHWDHLRHCSSGIVHLTVCLTLWLFLQIIYVAGVGMIIRGRAMKSMQATMRSARAIQRKSKHSAARRKPAESNDRLRELILYVATRCEGDLNFGAAKLNQVLYYADFLSYGEYGESITGAQYVKLPQGPAPAQLVAVRENMVKAGDLVLRKNRFSQQAQRRLIPLRQPDLSLFKARDIALVDEVIDLVCGRAAGAVGDLSPGRAWRIAKQGEIIPYEAVLLSEEGVTTSDIDEAKRLIRKHGWQDA